MGLAVEDWHGGMWFGEARFGQVRFGELRLVKQRSEMASFFMPIFLNMIIIISEHDENHCKINFFV